MESDRNLDGDFFDNGHPVNDRVGGVEVGDSLTCAAAASPDDCLPTNSPPNTPSPQSPNDWHVARDGRTPNLCWNNPGDPDGNQLEFYAEVYESAENADSGWIRATCWTPDELDGHYAGYQWRVRARDVPDHAESGWSDTRHFSIEAPNEPPRISFNTANGSSAGQINSRNRDWTFRGTASDPEGRLDRVEFHCLDRDCDNAGSGPDRTGGGDWSLTRSGMAGKNDVFFRAFDDKQSTASRHLDLRIDLAAPDTRAELRGQRHGGWFNTPVEVRLRAVDRGTGRALTQVKEVRYRCAGPGCPANGR